MKLTLKNIRQHKAKSIEMPDTGLVRIKGPSGAGKTSVFDAIRQLLYGDLKGLTHWDESSSRIEGDWMGMRIVRTMTPHALRLEKDGKHFVDDEAQAEIVRTLGMSSEEFMASSYIQQEFADSLLTLPPAEQLRLIQRLAFGTEDPEVTKVKIQIVLQRLNLETKLLDREIELFESDYKKDTERWQKAEADLAALGDEPLLPMTGVEAAALEDRRRDIESLTQKTKSRLLTAQSKINSPVYGLLDTLNDRKKALEDAKLENEPIIAATKSFLESLISDPVALKALEDQRKTLLLSKGWFQAHSQLVEIAAKFTDRPKDVKLLDYVQKSLDDLQADIARYEDGVKRAEAELGDLKRAKDALECPACLAKLRYSDSKLIPHEHAFPGAEGRETYLTEVSAHGRNMISESRSKYNDLDKVKSNIFRIRDDLTKTPKPALQSEAEIGPAVDAIEKQILDLKLVDAKRTNYDAKVRQHEKAIERAASDLFNHETQIAKYGVAVSRETLLSEQTLAAQALDVLDRDYRQVVNTLIQDAAQRSACGAWGLASSRVRTAKGQMEEGKAKLAEAGDRRNTFQSEYAAALRLKEISDYAALEAISAIFNSINFNAKPHLDLMFPDTGTQVVLKNRKELKSGDERAKPSLAIFHKGSQAKAMKELSGGERVRIRLAFHLAMSDLYKSRILLLDEPFSGLDAVSRDLCLDAIKYISDNKLVVIIEHGMEDSQAECLIDI